jgi:uncharacterized protein (DUF924 family)
MTDTHDPQTVLDFWFPDDGHWESLETHMAFWMHRMRGGVDEEIIARFGPITEAAARGELDHWAETPRGRLALLIALDQFPRSYWRDKPAAYAQDIKANLLVLEGMSNGHFEALRETWERQFYLIALGHCEGPDHLARLDIAMEIALGLPDIARPPLLPMVERPVQQVQRVRGIIERFGRHPHRNPVYGRLSTAEEEAYIAEGDFPHQGKIEIPGQNAG